MGTKELWARARAGLSEIDRPEGDDAALMIAGYLDGRLDEAERERVEAWLAVDAEALELMLASRADLAAPAEAAPESLLERAGGLVREAPAPVAARGAGESRLVRWLFGGVSGGVGGLLQPAGVAAALLIAMLAGAGLASSSFANLTAASAPQSEVELAGDLGLAGDDLF